MGVGEHWPPSALVVGLSESCPCARQLGEQSGLLMSPKAIVTECKDRGRGARTLLRFMLLCAG